MIVMYVAAQAVCELQMKCYDFEIGDKSISISNNKPRTRT